MNTKIKEIKTKIVEVYNLSEGVDSSDATEVAKDLRARTRFSDLDGMIDTLPKRAGDLIKRVKAFLPTYKKTQKQLKKLQDEFSKKLKKAVEVQSEVEVLSLKLSDSNQDLDKFKRDNQLSQRDLDSTLWSFKTILMMVGLTIIEMLISYTSLAEYFDGYTQLIGVNGGLGLFSSFLAMLAGQYIAMNVRINREIRKVNNAKATDPITLPQWVKDHPSVSENGNKWRFNGEFTNFLIISFVVGASVITILKFIEPLNDNNTMAYVIAGIVIAVNLIGFVSYEYFSYSGLTFSMRSKLDKKLNTIKRMQEKLEKVSQKKSRMELEKEYNAQLLSLKNEYQENYQKIAKDIQEIQGIETTMNEIASVVDAFESKVESLTEDTNLPDYSRLKKLLILDQYPVFNDLFN